jgi:hypothetical protein
MTRIPRVPARHNPNAFRHRFIRLLPHTHIAFTTGSSDRPIFVSEYSTFGGTCG